MIYDL